MILKRMRLTNFRQFKDTQEIVFAEGRANKPCITVLYGENGRGKTGIFRALMFGLYGDSTLSQDTQTKRGELNLVNRHLIEDSVGEVIKSSVEIEFTHNDTSYNIRREISGMKHKNGNVMEQLGEALLQKQGNDGNTEPLSEPKEILQEINSILDKGVREYFLFDGEKIERLTRASSEQRKEVSAGIRNLLNIDDLEKSISASEKLCRDLDKEVKKKSTGELQQVVNDINKKEDLISQVELRNDAIEEEIKELKKEKRDIDAKLEQFKEIIDLVEERKSIIAIRDDEKDKLSKTELECRQKTPRASFAIIQPVLEEIFKDIDAKREKGQIPPVLRSDLIQELLEKHECICGRELLEGSGAFNKLLDWMAKTPKSSETDAALNIWKQLSTILREIPEQKQESQNLIIQYGNSKDRIHQIEERLKAISEEIGESERGDSKHFEQQRQNAESKHISLMAELKMNDEDFRKTKSELDELERRRQQLENDASIRDTLVQRSQLARKVRDALKEVFESFKLEAAKTLEKYATEIMIRLLDEEGRKNLKGIVVEEDYSLQITDQWDGHFLANISAGQRQIMSVAFITSLAKLASGEKTLEMPLFMDTPFGRLSQEHRNNLIREIPKLSSQWILLATDTELRREEGQALLSEKQLGAFYRLSAQPDGTTAIVKQSLEEVPVLLKASMEVQNG